MSYTSDNMDRSVDGLVLDGLDLNDKKRVVLTPAKPSLLSSSLAGERINPKLQHMAPDGPLFHEEAYGDHPEPELLATSVGKELGGRLIPSSSTISLLSLNNQTSPQVPQQQFAHMDESNYSYQSPKGLYKAGLRSRNSVTHLNHKRFESYQRLTSPPPGDAAASIPINIKYTTPDSPNLDPTSLNGSPSRFWLSSQTPPMSLNNSYKKAALLMHTRPPLAIPQGSDSPILVPVQTPSEDAPMTPLYLSNNDHANYFNLDDNIQEEEEAQDSDELGL